LTYLATAASRVFGVGNPPLTGTVTGFAGSDTQAGATTGVLSFTTSALSTSNVGTYAINGSGLTANAGNYTFVQAASNSTALTITPAGQTITFTSVPPASPVVGGTYIVSANGGSSGNPVLFSSLTTGVCTVGGSTVSFSAAGPCQVAANQTGNQNYNAAAQVLQSMTVGSGLVATTTTIASSVNPANVGQTITFTATVRRTSNNTAATGGTVTFKEGATVLSGPTALNASGQASFTASGLTATNSGSSVLTVGTHNITAIYSGTSSLAASTGTISQVVTKIPTTTTLVSSKNPSNSNQTITLTATVMANGNVVTTGKVVFKDGPTTLGGPIALSANGSASVSASNLAVGNHQITAIFGPTDTHEMSTGTVTQTVKK